MATRTAMLKTTTTIVIAIPAHLSQLSQLVITLLSPFTLLFLLLFSSKTSGAEVTSTSYYHGNLVLDFLCKSRTIPAFVRDVPWDCTSYVVCLRGHAFHTQCPGDKLYSSKGHGRKCLPERVVDVSRCRGQIFNYMDQICEANPSARIPSPDSCGHYLDCQARRRVTGPATTRPAGSDFMEGLLECSYPLLFSPDTGQCQHHSFVNCRHRFEPKAPCDYVQYLQLYNCHSLNCSECQDHHPSCVTLADGFHYVPRRPDVMMKCQEERTVDFAVCPPGYTFLVGNGRASPHCVRA